jgi:glycosyltransferase involved in cell wall biosynthesis
MVSAWSRQISELRTNPKITIITVVRNGMPFIGQTIDSVLMQQYQKMEYIIVDGVSEDGTIDVIKARQSGIACWTSEKDDGIADAFNKGLSLATGDYLLFLNSDDALANAGVIAEIAERIVEKDYPLLIYGDCDVLDRDSSRHLYRASIQFSKAGMLRGQMLPHPSMFAHRHYFEKYGDFDRQFSIAMDYEWLLRGGQQERIVHVPLLVTNVRNGGISTRDQSRVVNEIILALKKNGYLTSPWAELCVRGYFSVRSFLKAMLKAMGLYQIFAHFRNK